MKLLAWFQAPEKEPNTLFLKKATVPLVSDTVLQASAFGRAVHRVLGPF